MTLKQVLKYFGTQSEAARAVGLQRQSWTNWAKRGYVPFHHQHTFEKLSDGFLTANLKHTHHAKKKNR